MYLFCFNLKTSNNIFYKSSLGSWKTTAKVWSNAQCEKIVDFPNLKAHTMTVFICKGYCNMLHRCNAINWNLLTSDCILWSCPTPIPSPSETTPSNEGYYIGTFSIQNALIES